jgi:glycerol uptake facilitator-like aquaporin
MINNKYLAEFIGTAILVLVITGSGIMGYDLSRGNLGIALLINSIATGIALFYFNFNFYEYIRSSF